MELWFLLEREKHVPSTSEILCAKTIFFYEISIEKNDFMASKRWLCKLKHMHRIIYSRVCVSNDITTVGIPLPNKVFECHYRDGPVRKPNI